LAPKSESITIKLKASTREFVHAFEMGTLAMENFALAMQNIELRLERDEARLHADRLAEKLAEQYLRADGLQTLLDEVTSRMEWYRRLASRGGVSLSAEELEACRTSEGFDRLIAAKIARLIQQHPLNGVS